LATYAEDNASALHKVEFPKTKMELTFRVKSQFLRVNDKKIVKEVTMSEQPSSSSKLLYEGSRVYLTQTDTHLSDPTQDSDSGEADGIVRDRFGLGVRLWE